MSNDPSPEVRTLHEGELERFTTELIEAGFSPRDGDRREWAGPADPALASLTPAREMRVILREGWPYAHPYLFVEGLGHRRHVTHSGNVCLWSEDEDAFEEWLTLDALRERIGAFVADQAAGAPDLAMDAHVYYRAISRRIAVLDLDGLDRALLLPRFDDGHSWLRATLSNSVYRVGPSGNIPVVCYRRSSLAAPPVDVDEFHAALTASQRRHFERFLSQLSKSRPSLAILLWDEGGAQNGLAVQLTGRGGSIRSASVEIARSDASVMRLRAGPDAGGLAMKRVVIFGVGSVGSEVATLLARSGVGMLVLVDPEILRPGNLTRHAAPAAFVGLPKAEALRRAIGEALPHVRVTALAGKLWDPKSIELALAAVDLAVDTTGNRAYADLISRVATTLAKPLVSVSLYRRGAIARVAVQAGSRMPIWARSPKTGFPEVLADPEAKRNPEWETGCGAPINSAPPWAAVSVAVTASRKTIDVLSARLLEDVDVVEVFQAIETPPFDVAGTLLFAPLAG